MTWEKRRDTTVLSPKSRRGVNSSRGCGGGGNLWQRGGVSGKAKGMSCMGTLGPGQSRLRRQGNRGMHGQKAKI